jgi:phage replication-related protein YjqB (UPF0714/DUF867 family)
MRPRDVAVERMASLRYVSCILRTRNVLIGKYASFAELAQFEAQGTDYRVSIIERPGSPVLIVAPHGGSIEAGTSEIARLVAGEEHSLFSFEGLKSRGRNRDLHITSHLFDHPECIALASRCEVVIGIHGCRGDSRIYIGGLDATLTALLAQHIERAGFDVSTAGHNYPGRHPLNICNRGTRGRGAQLEITCDLRMISQSRASIATATRAAISEYSGAFI